MHKIILNNFRSQFAHKAISCTEISQSFTDSLRLVRKIAIMHDKLNDAVEMINSSFSCEVRSDMLYMTLTYLVLILSSFFIFMLAQLLPGMVYALFTTMLSCFTIFRTLYNPVMEEVVMSILNFVWTWFIVVFIIASISFAASATKAVIFYETFLI